MNQTNGGSEEKEPCVVCMSVGRGNKELEIEAAGEKDTPLEEGMYITVQNAIIYENDTLKIANGTILNLEKGAYNKIQARRKERTKYQKSKETGRANQTIRKAEKEER